VKKTFLTVLAITAILFIMAAPVFAADAADAAEVAAPSSMGDGIKYIAAALAVGLCALATGIAQSRIGAAGMGSIVEKPETTGTVLIFLAIPETMVILGFVVAAMIIIL